MLDFNTVNGRRRTVDGLSVRAILYNCKYLIVSCLVLMLLGACDNTVDSEAALKDYMLDADNGLVKEKIIDPVSVKVLYRPTDLLVAQHVRNNAVTEPTIDSLRKQYEQFAYFILSLSADGREIEAWNSRSHSQFSERLQTLAFGMNEQVQLITSQQDTLPIADYAYQRTFGAATSSDLLFAFDKEKLKQARWVQFRLKDFGLGIGNNQFRFNTSDLMNAPQLQFDYPQANENNLHLTLK